jgi:preprotein translocase subunit YajC
MEGIMQIAPIILIIVVFYFLLIRPQRKKERQVNAMRGALKAGDKVTTIGGIKGTIVKTKDETLTIQVGSDRVKLEIMRWAISKVDEEKAGGAAKGADDTSKEEVAEKSEEKTITRKPRKLTAKPAETEDASDPDEESSEKSGD